MEQLISQVTQPGAVEYASMDDYWLIDQLFGIIHLERKIDSALSTCKGQVDEAVCSQVADLNARVEILDKMLDSRSFRKSPVARQRAC
jgi:hypothetical protein